MEEGHITVVVANVMDDRGQLIADVDSYLQEGTQFLSEQTAILVAKALVDNTLDIVPVQLMALDSTLNLCKGARLAELN